MTARAAYRRVLVVGAWSGHENLGDELLAELVIGAVRQAQPRAEVRLVTDNAHAARERWGVDACEWRDGLLRPLAWAHCVVAPLATLPYHYPPRVIWLLERARLLRRPTLALGVGAAAPVGWPAATVARMARALCHATLITTRDEESRAYLAQIAVRAPMEVTADPVVDVTADGADIGWLWRELPWSAAETRPFLAAAMRHARGEASVPAPAQLAAALDYLAKAHDLPTLFVPMHAAPGADSHYHAQVLMQMRRRDMAHVLFTALSGPETVQLFGRAQLVVASRLHALILAGCAGAPVLGIARAPKIEAYLARVGAAVLPGSPTPSTEQLLAGIELQLSRVDSERARTRTANRAMRASNARNWEALTEFLHRRLRRHGSSLGDAARLPPPAEDRPGASATEHS